MVSQKSHSSWWDSHISLQNSKWVAENLEEMDRCVKEMLKMMEEEGDSFAEKAEMYYKKRPELISHVEDIYRMYRALAERYVHVTGELSKNVPSTLLSQGSADGSDVGSEPSSPSRSLQQTPAQKLSQPKMKARAAGFDFFLGSASSSDSRKESGASSFSESASDSDSDIVQEMIVHPELDLSQRMIEVEGELSDMKEKHKQHEHQTSADPSRSMEGKDNRGLLSRVKELETELAAANEKLQASQEVIEQLQHDLEKSLQIEAELNLEREHRSTLEDQIITLEAATAAYKCELEQLNAAHSATVEKFICEMSQRDQAIQSFETEIAALRERSSLEKSSLEADIADRERSILDLKSSIEIFTHERLLFQSKLSDQEHAIGKLNATVSNSSRTFLEEKTQLESEILSLSEAHASLKTKLAALEEEKIQLELEKAEVCASNAKQVEELNGNLDSLKLKHDMLASEKDELSAQVSTLIIQLEHRDTHLQQLHAEHARLMAEAEDAQRTRREMNERVKDLEEEVERQRAMLSDGAEKKREAIRQLCFSLEHYRDGYNQLRQRLLDHRRPRPPAVLSS
ncbi:hypothetical protein Taro_053765 [Colocasia esculenta]|uniref:NAB domain-containing protein n=1 Tax=Colocasia esculenta TaxID=4460 RepID=A0A843XP64_COLES|nr:hypothetical protein [Colocasia esculenta]